MSFFAMSIAIAIAVSVIGIVIALPAKTYRTAKNPGWWGRNLATLFAVLAVGFLLAAGIGPDHWPGDPGRSINTWFGNAMYGLIFLGGVVFMPMGVVYLVALALVGWWLPPKAQRIAAVLFSPLITSLYWGMGAGGRSLVTTETLLFMLGMPLAFSLILTLPRGATTRAMWRWTYFRQVSRRRA